MTIRSESMYRRLGGLTLAATLSLTAVGDLSAQAQPAPGMVPESEAVASISIPDLQDKIGTLAHDSMRGRDTPSPELVETAEYVADVRVQQSLRAPEGSGSSKLRPRTSGIGSFALTSMRSPGTAGFRLPNARRAA